MTEKLYGNSIMEYVLPTDLIAVENLIPIEEYALYIFYWKIIEICIVN